MADFVTTASRTSPSPPQPGHHLGGGQGGFLPPVSFGAGSDRRLTIADMNHDGNRPAGRQPVRRPPVYWAKAMVRSSPARPIRPSRGGGRSHRRPQTHFSCANQGLDRVVVDYGAASRPSWAISPPALWSRRVTLADLNGGGIPDLIVANGSNNVLIYAGRQRAVRAGDQRRAWLFRRHQPGGDHGSRPAGETFRAGTRLDLVVANKGLTASRCSIKRTSASDRALLNPAAQAGVHGREIHPRRRYRLWSPTAGRTTSGSRRAWARFFNDGRHLRRRAPAR